MFIKGSRRICSLPREFVVQPSLVDSLQTLQILTDGPQFLRKRLFPIRCRAKPVLCLPKKHRNRKGTGVDRGKRAANGKREIAQHTKPNKKSRTNLSSIPCFSPVSPRHDVFTHAATVPRHEKRIDTKLRTRQSLRYP